MDVNKQRLIRIQIVALACLLLNEFNDDVDANEQEFRRVVGGALMAVGGGLSILCADMRSIRSEISDRVSSKTTQWYEKSRAKKRSLKWFKKHCRCRPETFDYIVGRIEPIWKKKFKHTSKVLFKLDHRVAVTLNYLNVGDFGIAGAFFGMSESTCFRVVNEVCFDI